MDRATARVASTLCPLTPFSPEAQEWGRFRHGEDAMRYLFPRHRSGGALYPRMFPEAQEWGRSRHGEDAMRYLSQRHTGRGLIFRLSQNLFILGFTRVRGMW